MGAESPRNRGTQPAWKAAAGPDPRGPQYKWKKEDAAPPGTGGRRLKQMLLLGGALACVAGFVWLVRYFMPSDQPCLVAISADPTADADRLDVPIDLYGWQTALEFQKHGQQRADQSTFWLGKAPAPPSADGGGPLRLPETEAGLGDWADRLKYFDPLVIYVGLHGGTDSSGRPFLFTGSGHRLPLEALLTTLAAEPLRDKRKVLILDCGRLQPDPVYGQIHDDFAARLKGLDQAVWDCPKLVVLCGAAEGQRGWESEELRTTAFGDAVLRGLRGDIDTGATNIITARALFESAQLKTREWAQRNRPAAQEPFLLPDGDRGTARAAEIELGRKPNLPPDSTDAAPLVQALRDRWADHDRLWGQTPSPAAYAPLMWRRYRELLLRYEQAIRIGNTDVAAKLAPELTDAPREIAEATVGNLASTRGSVALWAAANNGGVVSPDAESNILPPEDGKQMAYAARALQLFGDESVGLPDRLKSAAEQLRRFDPPARRPAEAHLPVMIEDFYTKVLGQTPADVPAAWTEAVRVRQAAERAAAGLPVPASAEAGRAGRPAVYPERVWAMTRPFVLAGDTDRRKAEDALFASDRHHTEVDARLKGALKSYTDAATVAQAARAAFDVRDTVLADLPFLTRWYAERNFPAKDLAELIELWDNAHALASELDKLASNADTSAGYVKQVQEIGETAVAVRGRYAKRLATFQAEVEKSSRSDSALQGEWWIKQQLLDTPLIAAAKRAAILAGSRRASDDLRKASESPGQKTVNEAVKTDTRKAAVDRGRLTRAALGDRLLDAQHKADNVLPEARILNHALIAVATADPWIGHAAQAGAGLAGHYKHLSTSHAAAATSLDAPAEASSRLAIPFGKVAQREPAAANHRLRWHAFLTAQAERTADDHWYDEKLSPEPYFKVVAGRYLNDARTVASGLTAPGQPDSLTIKLAAPPLTARGLDPITWTSELDRIVRFDLGPQSKTYPVAGSAVAVGRFGNIAPIRPTEAALARPLLPIPGDSLGMDAPLQLDVGIDEVTRPDGQAACTVYFRGQQPTQNVSISLRRKPELVVADPPPADSLREPFVAVRADRDLDLGSLVILLDYSGSMNKEFQKGQTRKQAALKAVADLLKELPRGTPLRVRVFSDAKATAGNVSRVVFGAGGGDDPPEVTWDTDQSDRYKKLVDTLKGITPEYATPLVQSISDAARNDFVFPGWKGKSKTLLVLTDGAEDDGKFAGRGPQAKASFIAGRAQELVDNLAGENVTLHVVQFALDKIELKEAEDLFAPLQGKLPEAVQLWRADTAQALQQALLDAIRPKLKLTDPAGIRPDVLPRTGWPSRADNRQPPYTSSRLHWTPKVPAGTQTPYTLSASPAELPSQTRLTLHDGERMILGFSKNGPRVRIRRELYADYIPNPDAKAYRADGGWVMAVPKSVLNDEIGTPELRSRVFLEQVPPHRHPKGDRAAEVESLSFVHPDLTWWQVTPVWGKDEAQTPTETTRVIRHYGFPAPTWNIQVDKWPHSPARPAEVKVWATDALDAPIVPCRLGPPQTLTTPTGDKIVMRTAIEMQEVIGAAQPIECLVVRFTFEKGKPVQVRPVDLRVTRSEHRYYGDFKGADEMIAYTAVFQLPLEDFKTSGVRLKLMPVKSCLTASNLLTLKTSPPPGGRSVEADSTPRPSEPVKK